MSRCIRCKKEFELGSGLTCRKCIDRIAKIVKADVEKNLKWRAEAKEKNRKEQEINSRFDILDL